ncbi:MAG: folylpolyglutamate synthase/dihydrofolate synthase family protein [Longimicrobiales bacterium]
MKAPPDTDFSGLTGELQGGGDVPLDLVLPPLSTGMDWGLERTERALEALGNPHRSYPVLHIGGTNGKGSVAAVTGSVLARSGRKVGLYTSPHLCSFRERFQINGRPISLPALLEAGRGFRETIPGVGLTFFEAATVLAFHIFARARVDVALVEVGLGGRLDSTNVVTPLVSAITNVAMDHQEYLGHSLSEIAGEKAGIIKQGVPVVTAETDPGILEIFRSKAQELGSVFHALNPSSVVHELEVAPRGNAFTLGTQVWGDLPLLSPLPGAHQARNVALASRILELLPPELRPGREAVMEGVAEVKWPGRLQIVERAEGTWVFDVAHNVAGVRALTDSVPKLGLPGPLVLLVGIQGDKDWRSMLPPLFGLSREAVLTQPPSVPPERRWHPLEAAQAVETRPNLHILPNFGEAVAAARRAAGKGTVVVTGSHHTVGDAMNLLGIPPYDPRT